MTAKTLLASIGFMLISLAYADYDVSKYCPVVQKGTRLPSMDSCETYYTCTGYDQYQKETCANGLVFSKNDQDCVPKTESNCFYGHSNPCFNKHNQFAPNPKGCNWYCWCVNGEIAGEGTCKLGEIYNPFNGSCFNGHCDNSNQVGGVQNICDIMQDNKYFGDTTDCSAWHKCNGVSVQDGVCVHPLVYDAETGWCLPNKDDMCRRTNNVVGNQASGPPKYACTSADEKVADTSRCNIYYTCRPVANTPENTFEWVQRTCVNQYYDVISKECTSTSLARAHPTCDRCQFKNGSPYWANAVDATCSHYFTCNNGQMVSTPLGTCPPGYYYNEAQQGCLDASFALDQYKKQHGACQSYSCTEDRVCSLPEENNVTPTTEVPNPPTATTTTKPEGAAANGVTEKPTEPADKQ